MTIPGDSNPNQRPGKTPALAARPVIPATGSEPAESELRTLTDALRDTASVINRSLNLNEVLEQILNVIGKVVPHDAANILLIDNGVARMTAWRGYEHLQRFNIPALNWRVADVPNLRQMTESGQPLVVPNTRNAPNWVNLETSFWIESYVSAPICHNGVTIGFINLNSKHSGFYTPLHAERLSAFADQVAVAIENARLYERAQAELDERKKMEIALQKTLNELEERVETRTAELRKANELLRQELTRRKQAEQRLEEERALLLLRVEDRTAELSIANAELARANRMKDSFLASISHELRTPLNVILNTAAILREQFIESLDEEQERLLHLMEERGGHLLRLINDILDLSKINAGKLSLMLDQTAVGPICQSSLETYKEPILKKRLNVIYRVDPKVRFVRAEARRLKQILVNLISNAVKFTAAGGTIGLSVEGDEENKRVRFNVWDTGIGIPSAKLRQLFTPFYQLDSSLARQYEGTGLGLALVYGLVRLHEGSISVESQEGQGSRFTVSLKWDEEEELTTSASPAQLELDALETSGELSDDGPNMIWQARHSLNELRIETSGYWYEKESIHKAVENGCDLFLLDLRLLTKGSDLLMVMRDAIQSADISVIIVAPAHRLMDRPTLPFGITFLTYPFTTADLRQVIRGLLPRGTASLVHHAAIFFDRNDLKTGPRPSILLADDRPASVRTFSEYLETLGYQVYFASSGIEVIERARETLPGLILLDAQIPGLDTAEIIDRIRRSAQLRHTPLVVVSSLVLPGDRSQCVEAGADVYLSKPFRLSALAGTIQQLLPVSKSRPE